MPLVFCTSRPASVGQSQITKTPSLLERLAALTPRPRINLLLYFGVLGARSAWRPRESDPEPPAEEPRATPHRESPAAAATHARSNWLWPS